MEVLVLLSLLCSYTLAHSAKSKPLYELEEADIHFERFIVKYEKNYSLFEKQRRFAIFKENLVKINKLNNDPNEGAVFDVSIFSDLTMEERKVKYVGVKPANCDCEYFTDDDIRTKDAPDDFDWRTERVVTAVGNQKQCGACWAFTTAGIVESQYAIKTGKLVSFSKQQLVDCDAQSYGCSGGSSETALSYLIQAGLEREEEYAPYRECQHECMHDQSRVAVNVTGCKGYQLTDEDKVKELLHKTGPLGIALDCTKLDHYKNGILSNCLFKSTDHEILLVGYGTENGTPYWILKNSYGPHFGENGYVRVKRGVNACGFLNSPLFTATVE